ncbi:hypothetical protein ACTFIZ_007547 [Dictyostelium cf. discoideum]
MKMVSARGYLRLNAVSNSEIDYLKNRFNNYMMQETPSQINTDHINNLPLSPIKHKKLGTSPAGKSNLPIKFNLLDQATREEDSLLIKDTSNNDENDTSNNDFVSANISTEHTDEKQIYKTGPNNELEKKTENDDLNTSDVSCVSTVIQAPISKEQQKKIAKDRNQEIVDRAQFTIIHSGEKTNPVIYYKTQEDMLAAIEKYGNESLYLNDTQTIERK